MKKVLCIASHFPPVGGAGVQRSQKFVRYLPREGYLPIVVTGPGPRNDRWTPSDPKGLEEIPENIPIYRVETPLQVTQEKLLTKVSIRWLRFSSPFRKWWLRWSIEVGRRAIETEHP